MKLRVPLALAVLFLPTALVLDGFGQVDGDAFRFVNEDLCFQCHKTPTSLARDLVLMNEAPTWHTQDKHAQAFELLSTPRGKQIATRLNIQDISTSQACLSCHANWQLGQQRPTTYEHGVSCQACHGAASQWELRHQRDWRVLTAKQKEETYNFIDVRDPVRRAQQCFSCHIGNAAEGKVVTHAMYAAGHPPLPSIELATFGEAMPPHWRSLSEKGDFKDKERFLEANFPGLNHDPTGDLPRTKTVILGGIMALRESVALFASQYELANAESRSVKYPEFALFDCASCHHDLRTPGWRQTRGYGGRRPGRPPMPVWPTALTDVSLRHLSPVLSGRLGTDAEGAYGRLESRLTAFQNELLDAVAERPFGNPERVRAAATPFVDWLDGLARHTATAPCDRTAARAALLTLTDLPASSFPDYHSAKQIVWAIGIIQTELGAPYPARDRFLIPAPGGEGEAARQAREERDLDLYAAWRERWQLSARETESRLSQHGLLEALALPLPSGSEPPAGDTDRGPTKLEQALPGLLNSAADYDPEKFKQQLAALRRQLEIGD